MSARLNVIANVTIDDTAYADVQIIVREGTVTVSRGIDILAVKAGVVSVVQPETRQWTISFDDGTAWEAASVKKKGGCGCS